MKRFLLYCLVLLGVLGWLPKDYDGLIESDSISSYFDSFNDVSLDTSFWTPVESDMGVTVVESDGEIKVSGVSQDSNWGKNGLRTPDLRAQVFDVTVDFKLINAAENQQSINLRVYYGGSYFGIGFDDEANEYITYYRDASGYHKLPNRLPAFGNEEDYFWTLRIVYDDETNKFQGFVDDILVGDYLENEFGGVFYIQFHQESQIAGAFSVDVRFDNFEFKTGYPKNWECWEGSCDPIYDGYGLSMPSADDGWAVGRNGISHWDGSRWIKFSPRTPYVLGSLYGVDMVSDSDGWAVGGNGKILHWDGGTWSLYPTPTSKTLRAIDMISSTDGWAVGDNTILRWDGSGWHTAYTTSIYYWLNDVEMLSATDGWAVGDDGIILHWDGSSWSLVDTPDVGDREVHLRSISMLSDSDGWTVGSIVLHWDGIQWERVASPAYGELYAIDAIDMVSPADGWMVGYDYQILHWDGSTWNLVEGVDRSGSYCFNNAVEMVSADEGWVFGDCSGPQRWDGNQWQDLPVKPTYDLNSVSMSSGSHGWAVGEDGLITQWDGNSWGIFTSPTESTLMSVDTISSTLAIAVGDGGTIIEWDGASWQPVLNPTQNRLNAVELGSVDDGWAVGEGGVIVRWDGENWKTVSSPTSYNLNAVTSLSAEDAWAVGHSGTILHWNGTEWEVDPFPTGDLYSISFISPSDGWAVGGSPGIKGLDSSTILHWNGAEWTSYPDNFGTVLRSVDMVSTDEAWAVGGWGMILEWNGQIWRWEKIIRYGYPGYFRAIDSANGWIVSHGAILHRGETVFYTYVPMLLR